MGINNNNTNINPNNPNYDFNVTIVTSNSNRFISESKNLDIVVGDNTKRNMISNAKNDKVNSNVGFESFTNDICSDNINVKNCNCNDNNNKNCNKINGNDKHKIHCFNYNGVMECAYL